ncbi:hypothetical protein [Fluviicola taffensis]|uniref:Lipoprotein n=1 Tax=Fluviicola taffensis (strain DSM 16823 / NCIMB 13979 / RW262) TaxID=755732 RepID=F2IF36_FLUTR|nr:hypothetical protein [Fluviicola taffensis]AEA43510.1 hypothetical protein Fluta_1517 [Fluviicola taffensis DSM 16823]
MKNSRIIIFLSLLLGACSTETSKKTEALNENNVTKTKDGLMMKQILVSAGQFRTCKEVKIEGHKFDLVLQENDTTYLSTADSLFLTPEKYHAGMTLSQISEKARNTLVKEPGWGYYIALSSGWKLGFCEGTSCTDSEPTDNSKVKWIFKRD